MVHIGLSILSYGSTICLKHLWPFRTFRVKDNCAHSYEESCRKNPSAQHWQ